MVLVVEIYFLYVYFAARVFVSVGKIFDQRTTKRIYYGVVRWVIPFSSVVKYCVE